MGDSYSFAKNGSDYTLYITETSGQTFEFGITAIDKNKINIYRGGEFITVLERIS